jgi:hypothetical protein
MEPAPVALNEQLPKPEYGCTLLCRPCRSSLLYQRQERPRFPKHFYFCPRCGKRYAAGERWSPEVPAALLTADSACVVMVMWTGALFSDSSCR